MIRATFSFALFLVAGTCLAQNTPGKTIASCPVKFTANVSGRAIEHTIADAGKGQGVPQLLEINFGPGAEKIEHLTLVVHGASRTNNALPVKNTPFDSNTQTFHLTRAPKTGLWTNSEVWLTKLGAVTWTEITEIVYSDGSQWNASNDSGCAARPSLLKLVNATAQ